jgi:hypothetical protein
MLDHSEFDETVSSKRGRKLMVQSRTIQSLVHPHHVVTADSGTEIRPVVVNHGVQTASMSRLEKLAQTSGPFIDAR